MYKPVHGSRSLKQLMFPWFALLAVLAIVMFTVPSQADTPHGDRHDTQGNHSLTDSLSALTANPDCTLLVPDHPLTARGLATPYQLGPAGQGGNCTENNQGFAAFVQATILDPQTGQLWVYDPVVETAGQPLQGTPPPVPDLPDGAVVAIWTGFNGNTLKLAGDGARHFVNFAQQSYDNSPRFFRALREAVSNGKVTVPALGTGNDGFACPTTRDFSIVDQDQSDNVPVSYAAYGVSNGSDEQLINAIQSALGCSEWQVPSLSAPGTASPDGILQEEQASVYQQAPVALVPGNDEFVTGDGNFVPPNGDGQPDLFLQNLYRRQVGQPPTWNGNDTTAYCQNLASAGAPRLVKDFTAESAAPAPSFANIGSNLALVLADRFEATWTLLNCQGLTGNPSPLTVDNTGFATQEFYLGKPVS